MKKKKLLLLNGSHSEIGLIKEAQKLGYYVITSGNLRTGIGHSYADENIFEDYSDYEAIYKIAEKNKISSIVSCCNDFGIITASYVAEKMNLRGHDSFETTCRLHHKDTFRRLCLELNIHAPIARDFKSREEAYSSVANWEYPVIVKPIDLTGGKGVSKVTSEKDFYAAVNKAFEKTRAGKIVIEPFIEGTAHSFSTFIVDKKVVAYFSDNEYTYKNPFLISSSAGPATDIERIKNILIVDIEKLATHLNLVDGIFHSQYILKNGTPYILEMTRRCSGDLYSTPVEHATGIAWTEWIVRAECGMDCSEFPRNKKQKIFGGRHCIMGDRNGIVQDVKIADELKGNIYGEITWWKPHFLIEDYLSDKLGILFLEYANEKEMIDKINRITELVKVIYED